MLSYNIYALSVTGYPRRQNFCHSRVVSGGRWLVWVVKFHPMKQTLGKLTDTYDMCCVVFQFKVLGIGTLLHYCVHIRHTQRNHKSEPLTHSLLTTTPTITTTVDAITSRLGSWLHLDHPHLIES